MFLRNPLKFSITLFLMRLNQLVNAIHRNYFNTTCMQIIMQTVQEWVSFCWKRGAWGNCYHSNSIKTYTDYWNTREHFVRVCCEHWCYRSQITKEEGPTPVCSTSCLLATHSRTRQACAAKSPWKRPRPQCAASSSTSAPSPCPVRPTDSPWPTYHCAAHPRPRHLSTLLRHSSLLGSLFTLQVYICHNHVEILLRVLKANPLGKQIRKWKWRKNT